MLFPQLAKQAELTSLAAYIRDPSWVMEQKLDGNRILLMSPGGDMAPTAITRNGTIYSKKIPQAIKNFRFPGEGEWAIDGELVGDTFWAFDLPRYPLMAGFDEHTAPLWARRTALETLLTSLPNPFKLTPQAKTVDEKIKLADIALQSNFEGLLLKKADSPYRSGGRTDEWLKVKFTKTVDVIVLAVRDDGKDSVRLGIVRDGQAIDVGRASLIGKEKRGIISQGDVLEVMYLYCNKPEAPRLYQPTILRLRDDKRPDECTDDQLQFTNKTVLETL